MAQKQGLAGLSTPARRCEHSNRHAPVATHQCLAGNHRPRPRQRAFVILGGTDTAEAVRRQSWASGGGWAGQESSSSKELPRTFLTRAACRTASGDRGTADHQPTCEISASRGCRGAHNLDRQAPRQAMPDSCKTGSARDHL